MRAMVAAGGVALALLLGGCKGDSGAADKRTASGEVLEGSASDAMLPLDSVTSQPPLLREAPKSAASDAAEGEGESTEGADDGTPGDAPPIMDQPADAAAN